MSGSRWVIRPSWLSGLWRSILYSSSVYSCHLFLIASASVRSIPFLSFIEPMFCMKCSLVISNFLQEISSLSHSIVFLYIFALIKAMTNLDSILKSKEITLPTKVHLVKAMVFTVVMYGCESWAIKKVRGWRIEFWIVVLEKNFGSPLESKEIKPVNPTVNQPWIHIGRTDAETEASIFCLPDEKSPLIRKDSDAGKDWRPKEQEGWDG